MSEKDGGPAFPHLKPMFRYDGNGIATEVAPELNGMSLRDWFAGQALAACIEVTSQQTDLYQSVKLHNCKHGCKHGRRITAKSWSG